MDVKGKCKVAGASVKMAHKMLGAERAERMTQCLDNTYLSSYIILFKHQSANQRSVGQKQPKYLEKSVIYLIIEYRLQLHKKYSKLILG